MPTETPADRQIAKTVTFDKDQIPFVSWDAIGKARAGLACHVETRLQADGSLVVTFYWDRTDD